MAAEIAIRLAREPADYAACVELQRAVWGLADLEITSAIQLVATVHAGGLLLVAEEAGGRIVGFSYAFAALRGGAAHLHSDMLAVRPELRGRGLGARLKWAQRDEALRRGIRLVTWTFDPMQAPNASLNLRRLGAVAVELLPNLYGLTTSTLHHGLPTDRLLARWELDSPRVIERADGRLPPVTPAVLASPRIHELRWEGGQPAPAEPCLDLQAPALLLEIPADWESLCRSSPAAAAEWQRRVSGSFEVYLARGYRAVDFLVPDEEGLRRALYVLARPE